MKKGSCFSSVRTKKKSHAFRIRVPCPVYRYSRSITTPLYVSKNERLKRRINNQDIYTRFELFFFIYYVVDQTGNLSVNL